MANAMTRIEHVVLLMMENRSFDHYLGALNLEDPPRRDIKGLGPNDIENRPIPANRYLDSPGSPPVMPWPMDYVELRLDFPDPPHEMEEVRKQWNDGAMDGFVSTYQAYYRRVMSSGEQLMTGAPQGVITYDLPLRVARCVMGYYTRKTLPVLYALADQFTVCDNWFSSFMGSTHPNRVYAHAGFCDTVTHTGAMSTVAHKPPPVWLRWERPNAGGRSLDWRWYLPESEMLSQFLLWLGFFTQHGANRFSLQRFVGDCATGDLAAVSVVEPPYTLADDHPRHDPRRGQRFLALVVNALKASPAWDSTALIITYDEHGGFFDHVPPPSREVAAIQPFDRLGMRVPAVVVSPWAKRGKAVHTLFDHRSVLKTIAERWGLELPIVRYTDWASIQSLWSTCFDFAQPPLLGTSVVVPEVRTDWIARFNEDGQLPSQTDLVEAFYQMAHLEHLDGMRALLGE